MLHTGTHSGFELAVMLTEVQYRPPSIIVELAFVTFAALYLFPVY